MIAIVDYGVGNISAFVNIYKKFNMPCVVARDKKALEGVSRIILPGVGSFDHAMRGLSQSGMRGLLDEFALVRKVPILGVCVGMQMLASSSEEGSLPGLGWVKGSVKKLDKVDRGPLPHMGWNDLDIVQNSTLFNGLDGSRRFYFLHSYYFQNALQETVLATTEYGESFPCVIRHENIYGIQCHPEKSHLNGMLLLKNFGEL